jgi:hypothetical protein
MQNNRFSLIAGAFLILLGAASLADLFLPGTWALLLAALGIFLIFLSFVWRKIDLTIGGAINLVLGGILFYQTRSADWRSWFYLWPLLFTAVGAGLLLEIPFRPQENWTRGKFLRTALTFTLLGLLASLGLWFMRAQLNWTVIIWGMGAFFAISALSSGVYPLLIPGAVLGGIGGLLAYQVATGDWNSWSYAWALLPGFVGLGLFFAFLRSRVMRIIGLLLFSWSLVVSTIFGLVFARHGAFIRFWPLALVLAGLVVLVQTAILPHSPRAHE